MELERSTVELEDAAYYWATPAKRREPPWENPHSTRMTF